MTDPPVPRPIELANPNLGISQTIILNPQNFAVQLSKQRWAVLFAITLFGFTTALLDETSPILDIMLNLLDLELKQYVYISQVFIYLPLVNTIPTAWLLDKYGMKAAMYAATGLMIIRNISRALLFNPTWPGWSHFKILYWVITSLAAVQTLSLFYCTPLKISEGWFSASERSFAWTVMISSTSLGISIAAFVYPKIIKKVDDVVPLCYLNIGCAIITTVAIVTCITRSEPINSPSERMLKSQSQTVPYLKSIKSLFRQKNILIHLFHVAIFQGVYLTVATLIQSILLSSGHDKIYIGNLISIYSIGSLVMLILLATYVHKIHNITLSCKVAATLTNIVFIARMYVMLYPYPDSVVLAISLLYCVCNGFALPNFNNMTAHVTCGIVSQATISGLAAMIVIVVISVCRTTFVWLMKEVGTHKDYTHSVVFAATITTLSTLIYIIFFDGKPPKITDEEEGSENIVSA